MSERAKPVYEFGPYRLYTAGQVLLRGSRIVPLTPKAFEVLLLLVQNSGRVVGKDELLNRIWTGTFVGETTLSQNIFTLRKALGNAPGDRQYIKTVPKRGFRFVAQVREKGKEKLEHKRAKIAGPIAGPVKDGAGSDGNPVLALAILPLTSASDDPKAQYLADGLTESIINNLSQLPGLGVLARSVTCRYKDREINPQKAGSELGAQLVLLGRILKLDDKFITRVELVNVLYGWQIWGEQYDGQASDVLSLQEELGRKVSDKLRLLLMDHGLARPTARH